MVEELFTDQERKLLIVLVNEAITNIWQDQDPNSAIKELHLILNKLTGYGTIIKAEKPHRKQGIRLSNTQSRDRSQALYRDPRLPARNCSNPACNVSYVGPAIYCSLECAEAAAL